MRIGQISGWFPAGLACLLAAMAIAQAQTATETVILTFGNFPNGAAPYGTPILDASGNLYGTTYQGGTAKLGVVFKLGTSGYQMLYSFMGGADGANPYAGVTLDSTGNLYGTTYNGGAANAGVVYKLEPSGQETVLYSFTGGADGANPYAGVILDSAGNLYGTTMNGGAAKAGVVYKVGPSGQETVLYTFTGDDGANPYAGVIADRAGNLYGTTYAGGEYKEGVLYKLAPSGQETVLHTWGAFRQGGAPRAGVIRDSAGTLYGTASSVVYKLSAGGGYEVLANLPTAAGDASAGVVRDAAGNLYGTTDPHQPCPRDCGEVYRLDASGTLTMLYRFPGPRRGEEISSETNPGVVLDPAGNLYGASAWGGESGIVYEVNGSGLETTLYDFSGAPGGTNPRAGVIFDSAGNLYGTAVFGGPASAGVVYKVDAAGKETVLYSFTGGADGAGPNTSLVRDSAGNLYGTTENGGAHGKGAVFKLDTSGVETVLHAFRGGADGVGPNGVVIDAAGNLYGTTFGGGAASQTGAQEGVVFKVDPAGNETLLHSFTGLSDGGAPTSGVIRDSEGNLYGTTFYGGLGDGVVYKIDSAGRETVLYTFTGGDDGGNPDAGVVRGPAGNLYGTNVNYGQGHGGVIFELGMAGNYTVLYSFIAGASGNTAYADMVRDQAGNLYGTTANGGAADCEFGCGVVFELDTARNYTVLHSFTGGADGSYPYAAVALGPAGGLYGTTTAGGAPGGGVLFKITRP